MYSEGGVEAWNEGVLEVPGMTTNPDDSQTVTSGNQDETPQEGQLMVKTENDEAHNIQQTCEVY